MLGDRGTQKAEFTSGLWGHHSELTCTDHAVAEIPRSGGHLAFLDAHLVSPSLSRGGPSRGVITKRPHFDVKSRTGQLGSERWDL